MSDATDAAGDSSRLEEFHQEVSKLRASGGRANPDRWVFRIGLIFTIVGLAFTLVSFVMTGGASNAVNHLDLVVSAIFGLSLTFIGLVMIAVSSFKRFMRYWLVRLVYEYREQTDRVVGS
ncbi:MAG: hypothetical protein F4124_08595 [Acidimicrobiia bacterium]|nr:hypothetical protein [bacterium]MXW59232.1 hypothetical protein [Acidimicrobiia bacterium]MXZ76757.1 hypothetical protein [Acidimicrobiia bacterium]MXZ85293.1 hypothetical protein [Acidimicrobiia bacterium]MYB08483.1 hypothetical protein [Acidimicrobiia bacterium]